MTQNIVVIGASAGGLEALRTIVAALPPDLDAAFFIVVHTRSTNDGQLPRILERRTALRVGFAHDGDPIIPGRIYVAPSDFHLILTQDVVRVLHGPRENGFRPAVDPLFRTAATAFGSRVIGVILSGALDDGTSGLSLVKRAGGIAIVQAPDDATIDGMPRSAIAHVKVDFVAAASEIAGIIAHLTRQPAKAGGAPMARGKEREPQLPAEATEVATMNQTYGAPSGLTCPECGGALWEIEDEGVVRYQCHTGHRFAPDSLQTEQREAVDTALWSAVRVLEEHAELKLRMAKRADDGGMTHVSAGFQQGAREAHTQAQQIRAVLFQPANGATGRGRESGKLPLPSSARPSAGRRMVPARLPARQKRAARKR